MNELVAFWRGLGGELVEALRSSEAGQGLRAKVDEVALRFMAFFVLGAGD
jgi:hypothetical protein